MIQIMISDQIVHMLFLTHLMDNWMLSYVLLQQVDFVQGLVPG
jgi:hypothetical protein